MKKKNTLLIILFGILSFPLFAQTEAERQKIIASYNMEEIENLKLLLNKRNIEREDRIANYLKGKALKRKEKKNGKSYYIADIVDGKPIYITTDNLECAMATKANKLHPGGSLGLNLEGQNMTIGVWDGENALATHVEFGDDQIIPQSRITYSDISGTQIDDHATLVAGTLIAKGIDSDAKGMAPKAKVNSYDFNSAEIEMTSEASAGLLLSNHSYGIPIFFNSNQQVSAEQIGSYPVRAQEWDQIIFNAPYFLPVTSAGNEGTETYTGGLASGFDKLTAGGLAKNNLVVASANVNFNGSGGIQFFARSSFSSQGPTDDFRIKPDITGYGENVFSTTDTSNSAYAVTQGTSFSAPNVTGSLILLQEYYNNLNSKYMKSATLRGLACHTALDDAIKSGPDPWLGWGLLDAEKAANVITDDFGNLATIKELSLSDGGTYTYQFSTSGSGPISATICWTDPAGTVSSSPGNVLSPRLINDLDLRLEDASSTVFTPWKLDATNVAGPAIKGDNNVDNIERIDITSPVAGNYTLTVTHKSTLTNGSQPFSLILSGSDLTLSTQENSLTDVTIWPNPVSNQLNIRFKPIDNRTNFSLFDIFGKEIYQEISYTNSSEVVHSINTNKFSRGFYILNIKNGTRNYNQKIIIK